MIKINQRHLKRVFQTGLHADFQRTTRRYIPENITLQVYYVYYLTLYNNVMVLHASISLSFRPYLGSTMVAVQHTKPKFIRK
jgi:hypothetical protein